MDDYRWFEFQHLPMIARFPGNLTWLLGVQEWETGMRQFPFVSRTDAYQWLNAIRLVARVRQTPLCPRVFVSHRQLDEKPARRIAWLSWCEGFDYWIDVIDLDPQRNQQVVQLEKTLGRELTGFEKAVLTAAIIEMALLNCTHVLAVMTNNTAGSQWVPYEYGRVKDTTLSPPQAACWHDHTTLPRSDLSEYLHLAEVLDNERGIRSWLQREKQ